jgi:hypothetical protein
MLIDAVTESENDILLSSGNSIRAVVDADQLAEESCTFLRHMCQKNWMVGSHTEPLKCP